MDFARQTEVTQASVLATLFMLVGGSREGVMSVGRGPNDYVRLANGIGHAVFQKVVALFIAITKAKAARAGMPSRDRVRISPKVSGKATIWAREDGGPSCRT